MSDGSRVPRGQGGVHSRQTFLRGEMLTESANPQQWLEHLLGSEQL